MARSGYFVVTKELIDSPTFGLIWPLVQEIFTEVARDGWINGTVKIHGISNEFDELPEGQTCQYTAIFERYRHTPDKFFVTIHKA